MFTFLPRVQDILRKTNQYNNMNTIHQKEPASAILPIRKAEHADFLRELFNGQRGVPIRIHRNEFIGRFIFSLRKYASQPQRQVVPTGYTPVEIVFPDTCHSTAEKHFCYYPLEYVEQINDFIAAAFDLYFHVYFFDTKDMDNLEGEPVLNNVEITRELLVDSFVFGLDMVDIARAGETIKKRQYRKQVKEMERIRERFLKKNYNFRKSIYVKRRMYLKNILFQDPK